jgi:putative sterol carrier protein
MEFFSQAWAEAARAAWNAGPSDAVLLSKLQKYWDWIETAKTRVQGTLGLSATGLPEGTPDTLVLELVDGRCVGIERVGHERALAEASYLLVASRADWQQMLEGFDMGKAVMYRKLRLERGEPLDFFKNAYYWKESLACLQRVPTEFSPP